MKNYETTKEYSKMLRNKVRPVNAIVPHQCVHILYAYE